MRLNRACEAKPVTKRYQRTHIGLRPVVLSVERYNGIVGRSTQKDRAEHLEAIEEEQRFKQYLINGNAALVRRFTNMPDITGKNDEELLAARDKALAEVTKNMQTKDLLDRRRKERIMRANHLLTMLKPGPRNLHKALIESETIYQRKYHDELNAEIAEEARRQQRLDEQQCPEALIPFGSVSAEQDKAQQLAMAKAARARYLAALEAKRQQKEAEKEQEIFDSIVEREQYKCIQEKEEKQRQELAERRREFCRNAYRESLNEKEEKARFEAMTDSVDDRIICVNKTAQRHLDSRYNNQVREMREKRFRYLEAFAEKQCQVHLDKQQHLEQLRVKHEQAHNEAEQADELKRRLHVEKLSQERRQYEREYQLHRGDKAQRQAEIRRFELAARLKNENVNRKFKASVKRKQAKEAAELRNILLEERDEFLAQREEELMRISACVEDPYLAEDIKYFADAAKAMDDSKARGRPLYPIAKAAEQYRRENQVDMAPQGQVVRRQKIRDYCWPGYVSKAQLAFRKYEHREQCKIEQEKQRRQLFENCLKITNMAAEERPFQECVPECPMKLTQHRGMPTIESQETIELPYFSCEEPQLPPGPCPSIKLTATACEKSPLQQELKCAPANELASDDPSFKSAISKTATVISPASEQSSLQKTMSHRRNSGGRNHSIYTMSPKSAKRPDLTHCWTAPPQAKTKAKNIPVIGSINQKHAASQSPQPFWPAKLKQFD